MPPVPGPTLLPIYFMPLCLNDRVLLHATFKKKLKSETLIHYDTLVHSDILSSTMSASPMHIDSSAGDKTTDVKATDVKPAFTEKEERILKAAWLCLKSGVPEVSTSQVKTSKCAYC